MITCTAYGPAGPAVFLATTRTSPPSSATGSSGTPRTRTPRCCPHRIDGQLGPPPSTDDRVRRRARRDPPFALRPTSSAGAPPSRCCSRAPAPGGTRSGSASGRRRFSTEHGWLLIYHGVKETVAGAIYRVGLALLDLDEPTARAAPRSPTGSSGRRSRTSARATCPTSSFPAASSTTGKRRGPPLLRRSGHLDLPRDGAARRAARRGARRPSGRLSAPRSDARSVRQCRCA